MEHWILPSAQLVAAGWGWDWPVVPLAAPQEILKLRRMRKGSEQAHCHPYKQQKQKQKHGLEQRRGLWSHREAVAFAAVGHAYWC